MDEAKTMDAVVIDRYARAAGTVEPALCCASDGYDSRYLDALPAAIRDVDYGCGDPTRYIEPGQTVVDLGSGSGKHCYIMAQKVGAGGRVIGVDFNDAMLDLARAHESAIAERIGFHNVRFCKGRIQDLALDLDRVDAYLAANPVTGSAQLSGFEDWCDQQRRTQPMIADASVDVVVSNCVLNLVRPADKLRLFTEIYRVLNDKGCAVISDIVCDQPPSDAMRNDPELWSGCISGAFLEQEFPQMFRNAGFGEVEILSRQEQPWQVVDGIEFRSVTLRAWKDRAVLPVGASASSCCDSSSGCC